MLPSHRNTLVRRLARIDQRLERAKELLAELPVESVRYTRVVGRMAHLEGARLCAEGQLATGCQNL